MSGPRTVHSLLVSATVEEVTTWLDGVTYKDGVTITPELGEPYTVIVIRMKSADTRAPAIALEDVTVTHRFTMPARAVVGDRRSFIGWLRQILGRVELHERDEWLLVDGRRLFDPHNVLPT
jgi:hypothetical protein